MIDVRRVSRIATLLGMSVPDWIILLGVSILYGYDNVRKYQHWADVQNTCCDTAWDLSLRLSIFSCDCVSVTFFNCISDDRNAK